jgi:hypothetical protein
LAVEGRFGPRMLARRRNAPAIAPARRKVMSVHRYSVIIGKLSF